MAYRSSFPGSYFDVPLGHQKDFFPARHGELQRFDGFGPPHVKMGHHARKDRLAPQGQQQLPLRRLFLFYIHHKISFLSA